MRPVRFVPAGTNSTKLTVVFGSERLWAKEAHFAEAFAGEGMVVMVGYWAEGEIVAERSQDEEAVVRRGRSRAPRRIGESMVATRCRKEKTRETQRGKAMQVPVYVLPRN